MLSKIEIDEYRILKEFERRSTSKSFSKFISYTKKDYEFIWFHKLICEKIEAFERKEIKKLMIFVPPQHGKSEISTRRYPAWSLGQNPNQKIGIVSYNQTIGSKFGKDIQRIMSEDEYKYLYPDIKLNIDGKDGYLKNKSEFEIPNYKGSVVSIGVGGALTSRQIDKLIIDDIYKDAKDAWSPIVRNNVWDWYTSTAETRLHNDSQVLIVFTRWHEDDLAGRLLSQESEKWEVIKLPAIKFNNKNKQDIREIDSALWETKHSKEKLLNIKLKNPVVFANLFQQDPMPQIGLLYSKLNEYEKINGGGENKIYCDVADTGKDYLCSVCYKLLNGKAYILDVVYTQESVEITEKLVSDQIKKFKVVEALIESNNGGRAFSRNVERLLEEDQYLRCNIIAFHQSKNKIARILSQQSNVQNNVLFPINWQVLFPVFYDHITKFQKIGNNEYDDSVDVLTGIAEELENTSTPFIY